MQIPRRENSLTSLVGIGRRNLRIRFRIPKRYNVSRLCLLRDRKATQPKNCIAARSQSNAAKYFFRCAIAKQRSKKNVCCVALRSRAKRYNARFRIPKRYNAAFDMKVNAHYILSNITRVHLHVESSVILFGNSEPSVYKRS